MPKKKKKVYERPLDPTRDAQDILGDTSGQTGITSGNPKDISAEPDEVFFDETNEPGGQLDVKKIPQASLGIPRDSYSNKSYKQQVKGGMSSVYTASANDTASSSSQPPLPSPNPLKSATTLQGAQTIVGDEDAQNATDRIVLGTNADPLTPNQGQIQSAESPDEAGEQSVSGDMPTPDSDNDTLANAQAVGTQTQEDVEHPQDIDIARDIDEAEQYQKTH